MLIFSAGGVTTTDLKDTLVTMVGTEPQVVTLLFDALIKNGFPIDEVVVLHTNPSKKLQKHTKVSFLTAFWHRLTHAEKQLLETLNHLQPIAEYF